MVFPDLISLVLAKTPFTVDERRAVLGLAALYALRMLGLFMVLPLLAVYALELEGATPALVGLALGVHGLTQGSMQLPLGWLSDRVGRFPVIYGGLAVFVAGSVIAALATDINGVILGRLLQGGGAVAAALMALAADYTRDEQRLKATAVIGASIGGSFALSLIVGPLLAGVGGLSLVFWCTAAFGVIGMLILHFVLPPQPAMTKRAVDAGAQQIGLWRSVLDRGLLPLYLSIFLLHAVLMAAFLVIPARLTDVVGLPGDRHWQVYLLTVLLSVPPTLLLLRGRKGRSMPKWGLVLALVSLMSGVWVAATADALWQAGLGLTLFFLGFNALETSLPALVSLRAPADVRGTAMGIFSSAQFVGVFLGGWLSGMALEAYGADAVLEVWLGLVVVWALVLIISDPMSPQATKAAK